MFQHPSGPEDFVPVPKSSAAPVLNGNSVDAPPLKYFAVTPIKFHYIADAEILEPFFLSQWNENPGRVVYLLFVNPLYGQAIQMIIVVVGNDDQVYVRLILNRKSRRGVPYRAGKTDWRGPFRQMGIGEDIQPLILQQEC